MVHYTTSGFHYDDFSCTTKGKSCVFVIKMKTWKMRKRHLLLLWFKIIFFFFILWADCPQTLLFFIFFIFLFYFYL